MADQKNQNQGPVNPSGKNPQGQQSSTSTGSLKERERQDKERDKEMEERRRKDSLTDLERKGRTDMRNEEKDKLRGQAGSTHSDDEDTEDERIRKDQERL